RGTVPRHDHGGRDGPSQGEASVDGQVGEVEHPEGEVDAQGHDAVDQALLQDPEDQGAAHDPTCSASTRSSSGSWTPIRAAACGLTTRRGLVWYSMGSSAGFAPFRTRSAMSAVCRPSW